MTSILSIPRLIRFAIITHRNVDRLCLWAKSETHIMRVAAQDRAHLACAPDHQSLAGNHRC